MSTINFDISQAANFASRQLPVIFKTPLNDTPAQEQGFPGARVVELTDDAQAKNYLGTPVAFPITLQGGTYRHYVEGELVDTELEDFRLPLTSITEVNRDKNITATAAVAGKGTVKELYSLSDFGIRIAGLVLPDPGQPQGFDTIESQIEMLMRYDELADSINVAGDFFGWLGIYQLAITKIQIGQKRGYENSVPFVITALSDEPIELIL